MVVGLVLPHSWRLHCHLAEAARFLGSSFLYVASVGGGTSSTFSPSFELDGDSQSQTKGARGEFSHLEHLAPLRMILVDGRLVEFSANKGKEVVVRGRLGETVRRRGSRWRVRGMLRLRRGLLVVWLP